MAMFREKPYLSCNFLVDLGTGGSESVRAGFTQVHLPEACIEVVEYRNGNERKNESRKLAGGTSYGNVVLKRGCIGSLDLYKWWDDARNGSSDIYRMVTIQLLNEERSVVMEWRLINAWPTCYGFSPLDAQKDEILVETIELAFERLEVE